ncbi:MAG: apolipoprotein N-acyltransferase [Candidatus Marinimicrobia bacterium]|nr:apolipoprotein N-acyltransferase [Candidatus Neomarinimicrobiota bacterium]
MAADHFSAQAGPRYGLSRRGWLASLAGLALALAFPPFEWRLLAWIALTPLLLAAAGRGAREAVRLAALAGLVFWLVSIHWIRHVTVLGWLALAAYCALYFIPPVWAWSVWTRRRGVRSGWANLVGMCWFALLWAGSEYLRGRLFTGFAWNPLAVSQYRQLALCQHASWGGMYVLSALLALACAGWAALILRWRAGGRARGQPELLVLLITLAAAQRGGARLLAAQPPAGGDVSIAVVQPNIPQVEKWSPAHFDLIYRTLETWTRLAARLAPALIVWPETAVPDEVRVDPASASLVRSLAAEGTPLLVGTVESDGSGAGGVHYYNSSLLVLPDGALAAVYDKQHLVLFGEYMPGERWLPWLRRLAPIPESFSAGRDPVPMRLPGHDFTFCVLICFEDTVPWLARRAVRAGAQVLINQTNDAWFDPAAAAVQHLSHGVFRSIENRIPTVRAANTGMSGGIDAAGRLHDLLTDAAGERRVAGFRVVPVRPRPPQAPLTLYSRWGDWFGFCAALLGYLPLVAAWGRAMTTRRLHGLWRPGTFRSKRR